MQSGEPGDVGDDPASGVDFSICIPSFNRAEHVTALLATIADCVPSAEKRFEVIVVLDGSTDDSSASLDRLAASFPLPLSVDWKPNGGLASARNRGVELASGKLIWFLDDDMLVTPEAVAAHTSHNHAEIPLACGPSHVVGNEGLRLYYEERWRQLATADDIAVDMVSFANASAPRALLAQYRFDEQFKGYGFEDYELALRMKQAGVEIGFLEGAGVTHVNDKSGFEMLGNIREEGVNRVLLAEKHPVAGSFALDLRPGRLSGWLRPLAKRGWSTPLWLAAHVVRAAALPFRGFRAFRIIQVADDLARYSGLASAWKRSRP